MLSQVPRPSIICADSDRTVLELLQIRLDVAGYQACVARTGSAALDIFNQRRPAALIIDAALPERSGLEVLEHLGRGGRRLPCPVLFMGRKLSSDQIRRALELGAHDCMVKPFSGAEALERLGQMLRAPLDAAPAHAIEARCLDQKDLVTLYPHEAGEHRKIVFARGTGMCASWNSFRQFLVDLGPAPDADHLATRLAAGDLTYAAGKVAWIHRDRQPHLIDRSVQIRPSGRPQRAAGASRWTTLRGEPIEYGDLADQLGVPVDTMAMALKSRPTADELVQHASIAETLSQGDPAWLAADRKDAFMMGYRMWHMQVHPRFAAAATPAFLYLFSALPGMIKCRDGLVELELWNPATQKGKGERDAHPLWRRFTDSAVRVESARQEFAIYKQYSLWTEIDELWARVSQAEERFRRITPQSAALAA